MKAGLRARADGAGLRRPVGTSGGSVWGTAPARPLSAHLGSGNNRGKSKTGGFPEGEVGKHLPLDAPHAPWGLETVSAALRRGVTRVVRADVDGLKLGHDGKRIFCYQKLVQAKLI